MSFLYVSLAEYETWRAPQARAPIEDSYVMPVKPKGLRGARVATVQPSTSRSKICEQEVLALLQRTGKPMTRVMIAELLDRTLTIVAKATVVLVREGKIKKTRGAGTKTQPFQFTAIA